MNVLSAKKFYPVIHCVSPDTEQGVGHALANVRIAEENGTDGVFLIGHGVHFSEMIDIYGQVRKQFPEFWIGINFLDIPAYNADGLVATTRRCPGLNALWMDRMPTNRLVLPSSVQVFCGVAFKYINPDLSGDGLKEECLEAIRVVDVATTSGNKTGFPPDVKKIESIKENLKGMVPLAIASGIMYENVHHFLSITDVFLVASSITRYDNERGGHEYLQRALVHKLSDAIHGNQ